MADVKAICGSTNAHCHQGNTFVVTSACVQYVFTQVVNVLKWSKSCNAGATWTCPADLTCTTCFPNADESFALWYDGWNNCKTECGTKVHFAFKWGTGAACNAQISYMWFDTSDDSKLASPVLLGSNPVGIGTNWDGKYTSEISGICGGGAVALVRAEGGHLFILYGHDTAGECGCQFEFLRSTNNGVGWTCPGTLTPPHPNCWHATTLLPDVNSTDKNDILSSELDTAGDYTFLMHKWDNSGASWTAQAALDDCPNILGGHGFSTLRAAVTLCWTTGDIYAVFNCRTGTSDCQTHTHNIQMAKWSYSGNSWGSTVAIATCDCDICGKGEKQGSGRIGIDPCCTCKVWAFFSKGDDTGCVSTTWSRASTNGGTSFSACLVAYSACEHARTGRILIPEKPIGKMYVAWAHTGGGDTYVNAPGAFSFTSPTVTFALTGTVVTACPATPEEIKDHRCAQLTVIGTLTNATWNTCVGANHPDTEALLHGLVSDGSVSTFPFGWNSQWGGRGQDYQAVVVADSPAGYWRGGSGTITDSSANSNTAASCGAVKCGPALFFASGQTSIHTDATGAFWKVCQTANINNIFTGGGSIEQVIRVCAGGRNSAETGRLITKIRTCCGACDTRGWELMTTTVGVASGFFRLGFRHTFSTTCGVWFLEKGHKLGVSHHVVLTYNKCATGNNPTFWVNGEDFIIGGSLRAILECCTPTGTADSDGAENLGIGNRVDVGKTVATSCAFMQETALYSSVLSDVRITAHFDEAKRRFGLQYLNIVRTSNTIVTVTFPKFPIYCIGNVCGTTETITWTAPIRAFNKCCAVTGTPTWKITVGGCPDDGHTVPCPDPNPSAPEDGGDDGPFGGGAPSPEDEDAIGGGTAWQQNNPGLSVGLASQECPRIVRLSLAEVHEICR